ncbi:MAG: STAS domain-containing protein [Candidatus Eisenbacteria bacterium]
MFDHKRLGESLVMIPVGDVLDNSNAHEMTEAIDAVQAAGNKFVVLDMSGLCFISSAGVGSILGAIGTSREMGGDIVLCNVPEKISHILEVLDLSEYITITPDLSAATDLCKIEVK